MLPDAGDGSDHPAALVATVLPDVTGLDKRFDYAVPADLDTRVEIGSIVRVELHGRRVGGWVVALSPSSDRPAESLKSIAKVTGHGPSAELIGLAEWAAVRWAARRIRPFLVAAAPPRAVVGLPAPRWTGASPAPQSPATRQLLSAGGGVLRLPPRADVMPALLAAAATGPTLVVVPEHDTALVLAARLRRAGLNVASLPNDWAQAAAGADVTIGNRSAAWAPCAGMTAAVLIDEHDEALQEERTPTWHARDVLAERCRRAGVPLVMTSPVPTLVAVEQFAGASGVVHPPPARERAGWPSVVVVDRRDEDPWKRSLVTSPLIERLRDPLLHVVCVTNTTGRGRVLACRACRALVRCGRCDAAVGLADDGQLACRRCGEERPPVCQVCGASRFANLRPGVTRLREELEAAAGRQVVAVTGDGPDVPAAAGVHIGTEAVLHRVRTADVVAFLEFDSEMLAPRFRAAEQALALIVRAGRLAPEVLVQTFAPDHEVLRAARQGDPDVVLSAERTRRELLMLPPYGALAAVTGSGSGQFVAELSDDLDVGGGGERWLVRASDWLTLGEALNTTPRPGKSRLRIEVDPPRV